MARKVQKIQDMSSDDDDAPEVVSKSSSKADAKRNQKALQVFEAEEKARRKARNRDRDQKLKERARATKGEKSRGIRFADRALASEDEDEAKSGDEDDVEARMLRAMREAENEVDSDEGEDEDEFKGFGQAMDRDDDDMGSSSDSSFAQDEDDESDSMDPEAATDDGEMDEDEGATSLQANIIHKLKRKADYLADDLFAAAFVSQNSKPLPKKSLEDTQNQMAKKRRRKASERPKDLVIGGRTIRTLPRLSDPRSQATARSVPSARARRFIDQSLAMGNKQSLARAKKKGWERRPANVGVMKYQGAPHGFARSTR